ncbi:tetratricopeptide repeat protein [Streptomyces sp. NBC_01236]|uniref:tetratricopeptide repeat protein n=1 Tax=Streptomyces sp. NBC_01236 TaxID=2903789 RepID=UPI003FA359D7
MGHILSSAGRGDEAVALYRKALALQRQLGTRSLEEVHSLCALGDATRRRGEVAEASDLYASAFEAGKRVGDPYQTTMLFYRKMARAMLTRRGDGASLMSYFWGRTTTWIFEVAPDGTLTSTQTPVTRRTLRLRGTTPAHLRR